MRWLRMILVTAVAASVSVIPAIPREGNAAAEYVVYSVYQALDMGNPGETPQRDYYINMGRAQGIGPGSIVAVFRQVPTYDLVSEKLYKDVTFQIATLKVIHVEANAAIARLDKMAPDDKTPAVSPHAVMIGDFVRIGE